MRALKLSALLSIIEENGARGAVITGCSNISYLLGSRLSVMGYGSGFILIHDEGHTYIYTPLLEVYRVQDLLEHLVRKGSVEIIAYARYIPRDTEFKVVEAGNVHDIISKHFPEKSKIIVDTRNLSPQVLNKLQSKWEIVDVSSKLLEIRSVKSSDEIERIEKATKISEDVIDRAVKYIKPGMREIDLEAFINKELIALGAEDLAFPTIVASGPRTSYPHTRATGRELRRDDIVVIDLGATYMNYCSDITRPIIIGGANSEIRKCLEILGSAIDQALELLIPGTKCSEVDLAVRNYLKRYGYDKYFLHSTGHGVGVEVHENPRISPKSDDVLKENMVVTIEPGIYIKGKWGLRIEELVLVTSRGGKLISRLSRFFEL